MNWLKAAWAPIAAAGLAALAILAAMSAAKHKATAQKWRDKAVDIEEGNVSRGTLTAKAANSQAKLHDNKAKERNTAAKARITQIGAKNEPIADVLNNWRKPKPK
jgi:hypothetical protein